MPLYFAYGSNLKTARLIERVGPAPVAGIARMSDHALSFAKRGADGSGKACYEPSPGRTLWGVLYELLPDQFDRLDRFEGGYRRVGVTLLGSDGAPMSALSYQAERFTDDATPFDWYKELILDGCREHGLPADWLALLEAVTCRPDPRRGAEAAR